jgi:hypothetical protein
MIFLCILVYNILRKNHPITSDTIKQAHIIHLRLLLAMNWLCLRSPTLIYIYFLFGLINVVVSELRVFLTI